MNEIMTIDQEIMTPLEKQLTAQLSEQREAMLNMAMLLRETNERMKALEKEVHQMVKVTPAQVREINAAIRDRAADVCRDHRAVGCEKAAAAAIRKAIRATCGTSVTRELARSEYSVARKLISLWDDYRIMMEIKRKAEKKNE